MLQKIKKWFQPLKGEHEPDKKLIVSLVAILLFGLVMLSSASSVVSYLNKDHNSYYYFNHQLLAVIIGALFCYLISRVDYHRWQRLALFFLFGSIGLLVLVFVPGLRSTYGTARSWITIFGQSIQPSEFAKLAFLLYLSAWLEVKKNQLNDYSQGILPFMVILGAMGFLMYLQPDLGTLLILLSTSIAVFFVGGGNFKHIAIVGLLGIVAGFLFYQVSSRPVDGTGKEDYKASRFQCLVNPNDEKMQLKECYQINQLLIAVGSGGLFGRGLGQSRQKFNYLPEVYGDAIFSIISEEIGFVFDIAFLFLLGFIFYRGYLIAKHAPDGFGRNLALGVVFWMLIQAFFNIGGMINLIPMTGVPLPFVSYGGSAVISIMMAMGLLINISKQTHETLPVRNRQFPYEKK